MQLFRICFENEKSQKYLHIKEKFFSKFVDSVRFF